MRIRSKILILLLLIALVPTVFVSWVDHRATRRLGYELAANTRDSLIELAERDMQRRVASAARILALQQQRLEGLVRMQAHEVERWLAGPPPPATRRIYFADDFADADAPPPGLVPSVTHSVVLSATEQIRELVSFEELAILLAPGVDREAVADDVARLAAMLPAYRLLFAMLPEHIYWHYTALDSGVHATYPGHGGYPAGYDPRQREWYRHAREAGRLVWTQPHVDASTRHLLVSVAAPVHRPDGAFAGTTAIDVPLLEVLQLLRDWFAEFPGAQVMLAHLEEDPESGTLRPAVIARQEYNRYTSAWERAVELEWLAADHPDQTGRVLDFMLAGGQAFLPLEFQGRASFLAAAPYSEDFRDQLVLVVPREEVIAHAIAEERLVLRRTYDQLRLTGVILLAVALIVAGVAFAFSRSVTRSVHDLADAAGRFAAGDLEARAQVRTRDELGQLGLTFNAMVPQLRDRIRMRESLSWAMDVQQHLLPGEPPRVPGFDIAGRSIYCDETGGDYYDFLDLSELEPHRWGIAVGDVCGHGVAAALLMATARALLRSHASHPGSVAEVIGDINRHLTADVPRGRFMTLFYLVLDAEKRELRWVGAGHEPALLYDPQTGAFDELAGADLPLGITAGRRFSEFRRTDLRPGQLILIGTDGIWETRNPEGGMYGREAFRELVRRCAGESAARLNQLVTEALAAFRRERPQEDDVTLVVIKVGEPAPAD